MTWRALGMALWLIAGTDQAVESRPTSDLAQELENAVWSDPAVRTAWIRRGDAEPSVRGTLQAWAATDTGRLGARARDVQVERWLRRLDETRPWNRGVVAHRDRVTWLRPEGLRLRFHAPPSVPLPLRELVRLLEKADVWSGSLVVMPGVFDGTSPWTGLAPRQPAEPWVRERLASQGLGVVRLLRGTWVVPAERARSDETLPSDEAELHRTLRRRELEWVRAAWDALPSRPAAGRCVEGAQLVRDLGMTPMSGGDDAWNRAAAWVQAAAAAAPRPNDPPQSDAEWVLAERAPAPSDDAGDIAGWLASPLAKWTPATLRAVTRAARATPGQFVAAALDGRLPYDVALEVLRGGDEPQGGVTVTPLEQLSSRQALRAVALRHGVPGISADGELDGALSVARGWVQEVATVDDVLSVWAAAPPTLDEVFGLDGSSARAGEVVERLAVQCVEDDGAVRLAERFVDVLASRLERDPMLPGRFRARLRDAVRARSEDAEMKQRLEHVRERCWQVGAQTQLATWVVDGNAWGWPSRTW